MVSLAHIGYGYWGKNLARNFAELGALVAVVDPDPAAAREGAEAHGARAASLDEVLNDPGIGALSIASPAELHFDHASAALAAGKHVLVEKPISLNKPDATRLCAMARERGLVLMVGHLLQYHPVFIKLRELAETGLLGDLLYVYSNRMSLGKFRREENVLWSFAPHDFSMILSLFGQQPTSVTAQGNVSFTPGVADIATVQMHFPGGGSGHVQACWMHPFKEQRLVVMGEKATAVFEDSLSNWDDKLLLYRHEIDASGPVPVPRKAEAERIAVERSEPLRNECLHFLECVDKRAEPRTSGEEGLRVLDVLERAEQALRGNLALQQQVARS
jgi:predicted dehydrogenase